MLVVDDSDFTREALRRALETDPRLKVVGEARTGEEAIEQARRLRPNLITMDLTMPGMGGLKAIGQIMRERPVPIVVISERASSPSHDLNVEAISAGAVELVSKSEVFGGELQLLTRFTEQIRQLAEAGLAPARAQAIKARAPPKRSVEPPLLVGLGASTGGPRALAQVLSGLPASFPVPIALVQHMASDFFDSFVRFLNGRSKLKVVIATHGARALPGTVYLAAGDRHLTIDRNLNFRLAEAEPDALHCPSVDALFESMADALHGRAVGVLMTGMGADGAAGLLELKRSGARTVVQDAASCAIAGMPQAALELDAAEAVVPLAGLAAYLTQEAGEAPAPGPGVKKRILIVDDSKVALEVSRHALEGAGYEVRTLENPLMVAMQLRKEPVDLVLVDVNMPAVKGTQVVEVLRAHGLNAAPVVLYSDLDEATLAERTKQCGAAGWMTKSSDERAFLRSVAQWLGRR